MDFLVKAGFKLPDKCELFQSFKGIFLSNKNPFVYLFSPRVIYVHRSNVLVQKIKT